MAMNRGHVTLAGVVAVLTTLGGLLYMGSERLIELDNKLGVSQSHADSIDARISRLERRLKIKGTLGSPQREGVARRLWHLIF